MSRTIKVIFLMIISIVLIFFCFVFCIQKISDGNKHKNKNIKFVDEIVINKGSWIKSKKIYRIKNTKDQFQISKKVKWNVTGDGNVTTSFLIEVPYILIIDGEEYKGIYELNSSFANSNDDNPKYKVIISNLKGNGDVEVILIKKN